MAILILIGKIDFIFPFNWVRNSTDSNFEILWSSSGEFLQNISSYLIQNIGIKYKKNIRKLFEKK